MLFVYLCEVETGKEVYSEVELIFPVVQVEIVQELEELLSVKLELWGGVEIVCVHRERLVLVVKYELDVDETIEIVLRVVLVKHLVVGFDVVRGRHRFGNTQLHYEKSEFMPT